MKSFKDKARQYADSELEKKYPYVVAKQDLPREQKMVIRTFSGDDIERAYLAGARDMLCAMKEEQESIWSAIRNRMKKATKQKGE